MESIDLTSIRKMLEKELAAKTDLVPTLWHVFYSKNGNLWSEDGPAKLLTEIFQLANLAIAGTFLFVFSDYCDPSKV